jgi:hypothetical protein
VRPLTLAEAQAARIVAALTDCLWEQLDPGGGRDRLPDFELRDSSGKRIGVLEVTTTIVGERAAFAAAQAKYTISDDRLRCNWFIVTRTTATNLRELAKTLPELLIQAEVAGFCERGNVTLTPHFSFVEGSEPETSLAAVGIWMLAPLPARGGPGTAYVKPPAGPGPFGPTSVTKAVAVELNKDDNLKKLSTGGDTARRELFVWLDESSEGAMALVTPRILPHVASGYPTDGPQLPEPVTRVWAGTGPSDHDVLARGLWFADGGIWTVLESPPRVAAS